MGVESGSGAKNLWVLWIQCLDGQQNSSENLKSRASQDSLNDLMRSVWGGGGGHWVTTLILRKAQAGVDQLGRRTHCRGSTTVHRGKCSPNIAHCGDGHFAPKELVVQGWPGLERVDSKSVKPLHILHLPLRLDWEPVPGQCANLDLDKDLEYDEDLALLPGGEGEERGGMPPLVCTSRGPQFLLCQFLLVLWQGHQEIASRF